MTVGYGKRKSHGPDRRGWRPGHWESQKIVISRFPLRSKEVSSSESQSLSFSLSNRAGNPSSLSKAAESGGHESCKLIPSLVPSPRAGQPMPTNASLQLPYFCAEWMPQWWREWYHAECCNTLKWDETWEFLDSSQPVRDCSVKQTQMTALIPIYPVTTSQVAVPKLSSPGILLPDEDR